MEFFHLIKASQKSGKKDAVIWFTAKSVARANLQLDVALEEAGIEETGRGKDYAKPIRTDFPVYDDLPEEGAVDYTWCERYELQNDDRTWLPKVTAENSDEKTAQTVDSHITTESTLPETAGITLDEHDDDSTLYPVVQMPFRKQLLSQFTADVLRHHVTREEYEAIGALEMDTDNSYVQNLLLAAENCPEVKGYDTKDLWRYTDAIRKVFSQDKRHELALVLRFTRMWAATDYIDRGILVREWAAGNRISSVQRTDSGTNADGGYVTDRGPDAHHTLDTLDLEIACALLPMDFNHFEIPGSILRRAKEIVTKKEEPWKSWSSILRNQPGALGVNRTAIFNLVRIAPENIHLTPVAHLEFVNQTMTAEFNSAVELLPLHEAEVATQEIHQPESKESPRKSFCTHEENLQRVREEGARRRAEEAAAQPQKVEQELVKNVGNGIFDVTALLQNSATHGTKKATETTSNVQVQETVSDEKQAGTEVQSGKSSMETGEESDTSQQADVNQNTDSVAQNSDSVNQTEPVLAQTEPDAQSDEPAVVYPAYFEPGRYEGLPNEVYHAANGISSTQVKDARVSLMYFNARHVAKTITKERSPVLDMGNLVHALALQPEQLDEEFSVEPVIPEGAFTTTATIRAFIDDYNAGLQALLSADEIKALLEEYNATLPAQVPLGGSVEETGQSYMSLPEEYQRIEADQKQTAAAMKACIKEYNATLPAQVKTSGSRDALLEQLAIINPDLVAQEAQKPQPLKVSGTKSDLIQAVKSVNPDAVFADELLDAWRENPQGKVLVTRQQLCTALAIQKALLQHPTAGMLLQHPSRAVEVSYFGFDDETGLEVRVRPDLEIDLDGVRIGADLKTISMWNIKQEGLRAKLHREIIDRDYHLSAAMYCETAALDQFFWIFVNKDENYHWIAIIEASTELLELGMLEYRKAMRAIATGFDTGEWPAPITADYTDELNDFDLRRLEALRTQA
ncbi:PD-(D/E)XK nuclease-like domain-containing protein [Escherichia coli]|uniref:RecE family exodeoxyribonuclease n=1 Tax=Escherichia coli TaxID=562 RepID=UPI000D0B5613|nr:RecE family exodeoxyribonuclease [Escherichia coli]EKU7576161.1 PD-(D/E)XK nuclease-like domain-containing protein [Escherichia coli]EKV9886138.1 PD-(D/E)XK nuclease-like domain-containing protein [Escherichia coli]ELS5191712.1 PD-(D/E)XK nuclease-like domain-containing protein [Escherichia coli]EMB7748996.1 PD-(D/E)XK nuclease-like domain-containing protein [Escherichia coli]MDF6437836.1 PD-(D/E)XK nuclease-like domain-containing protein [Escherichia coli]